MTKGMVSWKLFTRKERELKLFKIEKVEVAKLDTF